MAIEITAGCSLDIRTSCNVDDSDTENENADTLAVVSIRCLLSIILQASSSKIRASALNFKIYSKHLELLRLLLSATPFAPGIGLLDQPYTENRSLISSEPCINEPPGKSNILSMTHDSMPTSLSLEAMQTHSQLATRVTSNTESADSPLHSLDGRIPILGLYQLAEPRKLVFLMND
ncbi:unnamed protein product [Protopolystoma xenopodis]|uniref:Uncharacterized protein n=1 Tax=Protopolystoma xenopodis TaxID=117903 RepID=A0A3S4ZZA6_9PLAT|nr:unnamed protein product [Protopolystoma xenopodis]